MLPPDRFTEVKYETLVADREAETRRLIAFCGLEWDDACLAPERNGRAVTDRQPCGRLASPSTRRLSSAGGDTSRGSANCELLPAGETEPS